MDIDTPTSVVYDFSSQYPLPFRVLFLSFWTLFGFATNLHLLSFLGIDTALVLDIRLDDRRISSGTGAVIPLRSTATNDPDNLTSVTHNSHQAPFVHPSRLYPPVYGLSILGMAWTLLGWLVFMRITGGDPEKMVKWRAVPAVVAIAVGAACIAPWNILYKKERMMFLRSLRRTVFSKLHSPVPFSDIILADILTSSAKNLGDVWVSGCLLFTVTRKFGLGGGGNQVLDDGIGCARTFMVPVMTSLPYLFRLRQCISEVITGSTPTPSRSIANAIKYATAFPVIIFSAMQTVVGDPFDEVEVEKASQAYIGRTTLFSLWILAVLVNSIYSFWWDVTNDWGLSLLVPSGWATNPSVSYAFIHPPASTSRSLQRLANGTNLAHPAPHNRARSGHVLLEAAASHQSSLSLPGATSGLLDTAFPPPPSRPHSPTGINSSASPLKYPRGNMSHNRAYSTAAAPNLSFPFLRPILLLPDPVIYYLAVMIDFILRLTWSLKLSSHLHSIHEIESGIFLMEALEVVRRWMWVYLRIEWEAVRKGAGGLEKEEGQARLWAEEEALERERERLRTLASTGRGADLLSDEEIGLGILVMNERRDSMKV